MLKKFHGAEIRWSWIRKSKRQEAAERCRALAQRIVRELTPPAFRCWADSGLLEKLSQRCILPENAKQGAPAPAGGGRPQWVDLPAVQAAQVLLVCTECIGHG